MSAHPGLARLVREQRIIVCCGAGGVGKTTTAAATALAAARAGRKVLVLTIDPSRRLAETLGVSRNPPAPVAVPLERRTAMGIRDGALDAWLLDPKLVADESVRRIVKDEGERERLLQNRIYQQVSSMVAGMHEYTAMKALHRLVTEESYDLVVLDTPPSRNALDFLEAPRRLAQLLDAKVFQALLPRQGGLVARAASKLIDRIFATVFGEEFGAELTGFLGSFAGLFVQLGGDVNQMRDRLSQLDSSFLLVCSPAEATLAEVHFFREKARELGLPFGGFVLNRSRAGAHRVLPSSAVIPEGAPAAAHSGLEKLMPLARAEMAAAQRDEALLAELADKAGDGAVAIAVPTLPAGADDVATLVTVADALTAR